MKKTLVAGALGLSGHALVNHLVSLQDRKSRRAIPERVVDAEQAASDQEKFCSRSTVETALEILH
jgi:hypothetical protein